MKIDKIQINNFRAFYGENIFQIDGKNCLIYGENGSGKSSFYMALKIFIESSEVHNFEIFDYSYTQIIKKYLNKDFETSLAINRFNQKNIFSYTDVDKEKLQEYYDELMNFYEDYEVFDKLSDSSFNQYFNDFEKIRNKVNDQVYKVEFLSDKEDIEETTPIKETLLEDYREALNYIEQEMLSLVTNVDEKEKHFINIKFNDGIDYTIGDERKNEVWRIDKISNCYQIMPFLDYKRIMKMYSSEDSQDRLNLYNLFINLLHNFYVFTEGKYLGLLNEEKKSKILVNVLNDELLPLINNILGTFHTDLYIDKFEVVNDKTSSKVLVIKSLYNGKEIYDFNLFLNEARLSALSMAVYFGFWCKNKINMI